MNICACALCVEGEIADGTYELVPASEEGPQEGELNALIADQVPQESEPVVEQEGKPQSINLTFQITATIFLCLLYVCAFTFLGVEWNHSCIILSTNVLNTSMVGRYRCTVLRTR